jgi:ABC-type uncharacterized transport system fused permease/ATPase subunit
MPGQISNRLTAVINSFSCTLNQLLQSQDLSRQHNRHGAMAASPPSPNITVTNLTFAFPDGTTGLQNISLDLPAGSRTLLIGGK